MSVYRVASLAAVLLTLAGCAKTSRNFAANDTSIVAQQNQAAATAKSDDSHLHAPSDDGPLPQDPIAKLPPMPVALFKTFKKHYRNGQETAVAFLKPLLTRVSREHDDATLTTAAISPMPAAVVAAIKNLSQPGHGGATAFLEPQMSRISYDHDDVAPVVAAVETSYLLDSGDHVRVFIYGQPNLSHVYPVDAAGFIAVPLIGTVKARGLSTYSLGHLIADRLSVNFVRDPQVSVELSASRPFYILGEVRAAGQYSYEPGLTLEAAVAIAGGFGPRASEHEARITRRQNGVLSQLHVPLTDPVQPGDTITIEERWF